MILVVGAMKSEIELIIQRMKEVKKLPSFGFELYKGLLSNKEIIVCISGISKVPAAIALSSVLTNHKVDLIINIGLAGATKPYKIGDVVVIEEARFHDFDLTDFGYELGEIPRKPKFYTSSSKYMDKILSIVTKKGKLFTGDKFMLKQLPISDGYLCDMEGAAFGLTAHSFSKNILMIKIVSDIIGTTNKEEFDSFESGTGKTIIYEVIEKVVALL